MDAPHIKFLCLDNKFKKYLFRINKTLKLLTQRLNCLKHPEENYLMLQYVTNNQIDRLIMPTYMHNDSLLPASIETLFCATPYYSVAAKLGPTSGHGWTKRDHP